MAARWFRDLAPLKCRMKIGEHFEVDASGPVWAVVENIADAIALGRQLGVLTKRPEEPK